MTLKMELFAHESLNYLQRLAAKILKLVDVSYGGENGFNQAIELSAEVLSNVKFIQEKKLIGKYFEEISQDTGKYCFGYADTLRSLEMGSVEILICWENLDIMRYQLKNPATGEEKVLHLTPEQEKDKSHFSDKETGTELELVEPEKPLLEWLANNYKTFGATLEIITDRSRKDLNSSKDSEVLVVFYDIELIFKLLMMAEMMILTTLMDCKKNR